MWLVYIICAEMCIQVVEEKKEVTESDFQSVASTRVSPLLLLFFCFVNNPQKLIFFCIHFNTNVKMRKTGRGGMEK